MKKLQMALVAVLMTASAAVAGAQDAQPQGRQGRGNMMPMLLQGITLTAEQQAKVDTVNKKFDDQRAAIRADQSIDVGARRAKSRELTTKQVEEVKALLNDEQKKVLDKNWTEAQARMQRGGRPPQS